MRISLCKNERKEIYNVSDKTISFNSFFVPEGDVSKYKIELSFESSTNNSIIPLIPTINPYWQTRSVFPIHGRNYKVSKNVRVYLQVIPRANNKEATGDLFIDFEIASSRQ